MSDWETLDTEKLLRKRREQHEATTSTGVGSYETPLGEPLRPSVVPCKPVERSKKKKKRETD